MYLLTRFIFGVVFLISISVSAQRVDNTASFRNIRSDNYFRFNYDNDFFTATDQYYTQGVIFEIGAPWIKKTFLSKILLTADKSNCNFNFALEQDCFTPTSIRHNEIIIDDHPFAACLMIKFSSISADTIIKFRTTSAVTLGVIGPNAFGEETQKSIHKWLKNIEPLGWDNQVGNDIILNYRFSFEKKILSLNDNFLLNTNSQIDVGTLSDRVKAGLTLMAGKFDSPFDGSMNMRSRLQFYFYSQFLIGFVGYDATLEGGIFNQESPYTLNSSEISRFTFEASPGIVLTLGKLYLEYYQSIQSKEFTSATFHRWGGIKIGVSFN